MGLSRVQGTHPTATAKVLGVRHRLKVGRVDARPVPAQVVELEIRRDRADPPLVGQSVRLSKAHSSGARLDDAVPIRPRARPQPALARPIHLVPETLLKRSHLTMITVQEYAALT